MRFLTFTFLLFWSITSHAQIHRDTIISDVVYDLGDGFVEKLDTIYNAYEVRVVEIKDQGSLNFFYLTSGDSNTGLQIDSSSITVEFREVWFYLPDSSKVILNPNRIIKFIRKE